MVGRTALVLGVLLLYPGAWLNAPQAAAQAEHASPAKSAKAPVPRISISPRGMLVDINSKSADDLTIHCSIDGDLSQVSKAWVEITDGPHGKVLFTQPVPIQPTGDVIWPRGQPTETTPNEIYFQVSNSDEAVSTSVRADSEYPLPDDDPTPILSSITPRLIVKGAKDASIVLRGRNFIPNAMVTFSKNGIYDDAKLKPRFISSHVLTLRVPASLVTEEKTWEVEVLQNDVSNSEPVDLRIVPPGLPSAPTLTSISPNRLPSSEKPQAIWITLRGDNYRKDTKVRSDGVDSELQTKFISPHEMRALIPAWWLSDPWRANIHLESARDADLASQALPVTVLNTVRHAPWPILDSVNDGYVVIPASREAPPVTVTLLGSNFVPHSRVVADVDGESRTLKTLFVSSHKLRTVVPSDFWSQRFFVVTLSLETKPAAAAATGKTLTAVASLR